MSQYSLHLILVLQSLYPSFGVFFHERSHVTLKPVGDQETFGFSLAYQGGRQANLIVGAPHSDLTGKVFNCPLHKTFTTTAIDCKEAVIDVDKLAPYSRDYEPNIKLNLGYSVSAREDYFFTCAPLWTSRIQTAANVYSNYSMGTCFVYDDKPHQYTGFMETLGDKIAPPRIRGGNGWRTLLDQENDLLLIAKVAGESELTHVNASEPLQHVVSMMHADSKEMSRKRNAIHFKNYRNLGSSIAVGKFFNSSMTHYAISALSTDTNKGTIQFIYPFSSEKDQTKKMFLLKANRKPVIIKDDVAVGSMFGSAMCSANLNLDLLSELVVGAPAQENIEEGVYEAGAVHIYLGGNKEHINDDIRHRVILGNKELSRFGSAVAANDIDGDYLSEIFVSAPYEDLGEGALYIISGYELYKKLKNTFRFATISMSQLELTQRIKSSTFNTFGYSLQVIPDIDGNGCDELAVGSPGSKNVMLLRCLPSLNVTVEANHIGNQTTVHDTNFIVSVCVSVQDSRNRSLPLALSISNEVKGEGAYIEDKQTKIIMTILSTSSKQAKNCEDITVKLYDGELGTYFFHTVVELAEDVVNSNDFNSTRAILSPYSKLKADERVTRQCKGSDCEPNLSMDLTWSGGSIHEESEGLSYDLGSSEVLTANLRVTNAGNSSFESCALIYVRGATVAKLGCSEDRGQYKCYMPIPLKRNAEYPINIKLNMTQPTNEEEEIRVHVILHDFCNKPEKVVNRVFTLKKNFQPNDVVLTGSSQDRQISDTEIQDERDLSISDAHEYWIANNGNVTWINIDAEVTFDMKPFITSYRVSSVLNDCSKDEDPDKMVFLCTLTLAPRSKAKIIASSDIVKDKIIENLKENKLILQSTLYLSNLYPSYSEKKQHSLSTTITFKKEQSLAQNKNLIVFLAVLGAAVAIIVLIFILNKMKFFTRTQKTKLEELKQEHVRRQSVKRSMSLNDDAAGLDMEVDDDSPFEIIDMETPVLQDDKCDD